jgi:hypothetical protein
MVRRAAILGPALLLCGCTNLPMSETPSTQVSGNLFGVQAPPAAPTRTNFAPASQEVAWRVDRVGRDIIAANPQLGLKIAFATVGTPVPEIFHRDDKMVVITEGLIKQCKNDAELAAVLCHELGRMVADRESLVPADVRNPDRLPPINSSFGGATALPGPDLTAVAELGKFEKDHPKTHRPLPRPDENKIACTALTKAGFKVEDLQAVQPLLRAAERNCALENQFKGTLTQSGWTP